MAEAIHDICPHAVLKTLKTLYKYRSGVGLILPGPPGTYLLLRIGGMHSGWQAYYISVRYLKGAFHFQTPWSLFELAPVAALDGAMHQSCQVVLSSLWTTVGEVASSNLAAVQDHNRPRKKRVPSEEFLDRKCFVEKETSSMLYLVLRLPQFHRPPPSVAAVFFDCK